MNAAAGTPSVGQLTAENLSIEAENGITYEYRRFGSAAAGRTPLVFLQHFRGNLDNWDPLLVDRVAAEREAILLDNTGVGLSSGTVPTTVTEMARDAIAFCDALELREVDVLGNSLGGMVAQEIALFRPRMVRRLVLAGTGPRGGGRQMHGWIFDIEQTATLRTTASRSCCTSSSTSPRRAARPAASTSSARSAGRRAGTSRTAPRSRERNTTRSSSGASPIRPG